MYVAKTDVRRPVTLRATQNAILTCMTNEQPSGVYTILMDTLLAGDALGASE